MSYSDDYDYSDSFIDDADVDSMIESSEEEYESENSDPLYDFYIMMIRAKQKGGWDLIERSYYWRYIFKQLDTVLHNCGSSGSGNYATTIDLVEKFKQWAELSYDRFSKPCKGKCYQCKLTRLLSYYVTITEPNGKKQTFSIGCKCLERLLRIKRVIDIINTTSEPTGWSYDQLDQAVEDLVTEQSSFGKY
jgi:hypothetical protein